MKEPDSVYRVVVYGGEYDDKYEHTIAVFYSKETADTVAKLYNDLRAATNNLVERLLKLNLSSLAFDYDSDVDGYFVEELLVSDADDYFSEETDGKENEELSGADSRAFERIC